MTPPRPIHKYQTDRTKSVGSLNAKHVFLKSLSVSNMMKLGKLDKPNESVSVLEGYSFGLENIAWSLLTHCSLFFLPPSLK